MIPGRRADSLLSAIRRRVRAAPYLHKWIVLGALIGVISGLGAAVFSVALDLGTRLFLVTLAGFTPASPMGEGARPISDAARPWAIPLVVALGGLIAGIIVFRLAPEAEGHGTDAAIAAFHHGPRRIRARIPLIKLVASAITIGSGGSGGREGPTAQIGAGFGSFLARLLDLDARDARIAVSTGIGSGIGAIFRAPLGGAVLAVEIPYRDDVESDALVPAFVGSIVAFSVFGALISFSPIFGRASGAGFTEPSQLVYYSLIGLACGVVGRLYIASFYGLTQWFRRWPLPREIRPAVAGFGVGCLGVALPGVLGTGYGWAQAGFDRDALLSLSLWVVLALPFAKILATSLSIGSGGSGGIFGPGMVIGALLGAGVWRLLEPMAPGVPADPSPFVIVAMMALFGSVARAPLAVMLMVAEMTDSLAMLAPAMLAIGIATLIVGDRSIYHSQIRSRGESPAHRFRYALPLLTSIPAGDAARAARVILRSDQDAASALAELKDAGVPGGPVVARNGSLRGAIEIPTLEAADPAARVGELALDEATISADDSLDDALGLLTDSHRSWAPVEADGQLAGILSARDTLSAYRQALSANVRRVRSVGQTGSMVEAEIGTGSVLAGKHVSEAAWPRDSVLVSIARGEHVVVPRGDVVLQVGDRLTVFSAGAARQGLQTLLSSQIEAGSEEP
jgi:CIC family chloride channel protein